MPRTMWRRLLQRMTGAPTRAERRLRARQTASPGLEVLEPREVPAVMATPDFLLKTDGNEVPLQTSSPEGYTPSQVLEGYGFNQISDNGAGTTIAIVDAYNDPKIASDLSAFDSKFDLPKASLTVVSQTGSTTKLPANSGTTGWSEEESLDVEWAHVVAPDAKILLVEANDASLPNLLTGVDYAAAQKGVVAVSMSWGGSEFYGETAYDGDLLPAASNPNVVFVNSSGDTGSPANYPSTSPNVLSVGGTTLKLSSSGVWESETAWSGSSGGPSLYEPAPTWQASDGVNSQFRTDPDVAYDANPNTGFAVYDSYDFGTKTPWAEFGGTSCGSPQWAGLIADADQALISAGQPALNNATLMPELYDAPSSDFHDITSGSNGGYKAGPGYDLVTGLGSPIVNNLVGTLTGGSSRTATQFTVTASTSDQYPGQSFTITVTAENANGQTATGYTGSVALSSSDPDAALPYTSSNPFTFTAADDGVATFTVTLNTPGTDSITVTSTAGSSVKGSATFDVGPHFVVSGVPSSVTAGESEEFTIQAVNSDGTTDSGYSGTVNLTAPAGDVVVFSQSQGGPALSNPVSISGGSGTFWATFETASPSGSSESITATDTSFSSITGVESGITVLAGAPTQLIFSQQPTAATVGIALYPAVKVTEEDAFGNVVATDSSSSITLTLNPVAPGGSGTLGGIETVTVVNGSAAFNSLTVSSAGTYTLTAADALNASTGATGTLTAVSSSFAVSANDATVLENFQDDLGLYFYAGSSRPAISLTTAAAHASTGAVDGLADGGDGNWYFRKDSGAVVSPGNTISAWIEFPSVANGRAYFGFGTVYTGSNMGLDSVVLAPNTNQFMIQSNPDFVNYSNLKTSSQTYSANTWYLVQVAWGTQGTVTATLSTVVNGALKQLNSITASTGYTTPGPFAFRAIGSTKYFSTVTETSGDVNNVALAPTKSSTGDVVHSSDARHLSVLPVSWGIWLPSTTTGNSPSHDEGLEYLTSHQEEEESGWGL